MAEIINLPLSSVGIQSRPHLGNRPRWFQYTGWWQKMRQYGLGGGWVGGEFGPKWRCRSDRTRWTMAISVRASGRSRGSSAPWPRTYHRHLWWILGQSNICIFVVYLQHFVKQPSCEDITINRHSCWSACLLFDVHFRATKSESVRDRLFASYGQLTEAVRTLNGRMQQGKTITR